MARPLIGRGFVSFMRDLPQNIWLSVEEGVNGLGGDG